MQAFIKSSLNYIEQNLKTDITAEELASMANYSVGHYCRVFGQVMGSSVGYYIVKRRLDHALAEISSGRKSIDVVLEYGFNTYAGFYKAFVKMYGCAPKKYLSIYGKTEECMMQSEKDIMNILENWDIPKGLEIQNVSAHGWNIWQIGSEYYLKTNERSKMIRNIKIAKALKEQRLDSEFLPIPTKSGEDYLDGEHIFLLVKKIGKPMDMKPWTDEEIRNLACNSEREKHAFKLGQGIARLHNALKSVQDDIKPDERNLYKQGINAIKKVKQFNLNIAEDFFNDYTETFGALYDKLPKQLIHGNPVGDSAIYKNGEIVCFKGFEIYNISHIRIFDVIYCAGETNTQPSIDLYLQTLKEIIKGYDSLNPLTIEEKQSIYYVLCSIGMNMIAHCDETWDVFKRNCKALVFLSENKAMFCNLL